MGARPDDLLYNQNFINIRQRRKSGRPEEFHSIDSPKRSTSSLVGEQDLNDSSTLERQTNVQQQHFNSQNLSPRPRDSLINGTSSAEYTNSRETTNNVEHNGEIAEMVGDGGPPFEPLQQCARVCNEDGSRVVPFVFAKVEKAFFYVNETWICYRRNYFKATGGYSLHNFPKSKRIYISPSGDKSTQLVSAIGIAISARVLDTNGKPIELVQHTAKRDKGPVDTPSQLFVECCQDDHIGEGIYGWDRLQFKSATANNGKRKAAQQYFGISIELRMKTSDGMWYAVGSRTSVGFVVRGRSPGHYNDRYPLPGEPYAIPKREAYDSTMHNEHQNRRGLMFMKQETGASQNDFVTLRQDLVQSTLQQPSPQLSLQSNYEGTPHLALGASSPAQAYAYDSNMTPTMFFDKLSPEMSTSPFLSLAQSQRTNAQSRMTTPSPYDCTTPRLTDSPHWIFPEPNTSAVANSSAKPLPMISECAPPNFDSNSAQLPSNKSTVEKVESLNPTKTKSSHVSLEVSMEEFEAMEAPKFPALTSSEEKELLQPVEGYVYYPSTLVSPCGTPAVPVGGIIFDPHATHTNRLPDADDHSCLHASGVAWGGFQVQPYIPGSVAGLGGGSIGPNTPMRRPSNSSTNSLDKTLKCDLTKGRKERITGTSFMDKTDYIKIVANVGMFEGKDSSAGYYPDLQPV